MNSDPFTYYSSMAVFWSDLLNCKCYCSAAVPGNDIAKGQQKELENMTVLEMETTTIGKLNGALGRILKCNRETSNSCGKDLGY